MSNLLFKQEYLAELDFNIEALPFQNDDIYELDKKLLQYERSFLKPETEKFLITKNELLASFAISKAENSELTLKEAGDVHKLLVENKEYKFIGDKLKLKFKLARKDYEKLEFYNVAKTFMELSKHPLSLDDFDLDFIKDLHGKITFGMDLFQKYFLDFSVYKSGQLRNTDNVRVGDYTPPPYEQIEPGIKELISWLKDNVSPVSIAIFHTALYGLHPFNNGNKRVCRILEHILLRAAGLNRQNLYSTSYYYHKQKPRYYSQLHYSLMRNNINHFASFILEAIVLSIISVVKTSMEIKRAEFVKGQETSPNVELVMKPLVKRRELQFKNLFKFLKNKMARQTFVTALDNAVRSRQMLKRGSGRATFYKLNGNFPEEATLDEWLSIARQRLNFIPDDIKLA